MFSPVHHILPLAEKQPPRSPIITSPPALAHPQPLIYNSIWIRQRKKETMLRFILSLAIGLAVGLGVGLYLGWVQFPVEFVNSPAADLSPRYKDEYTVMIATGFLGDGDLQAVVERLRPLGVNNIPAYVQETAERYITNSQNVNDIRVLVALAEAMDRLTPIMEPYRQVSLPGQSQ